MPVNGLGFHLDQGEILGLIGPNGAGKTTVFNMITGTLRPTHGDVVFRGTRINDLEPSKIAQLGAVRTFQLTNLFPDMTVTDNVILGTHHKSGIGLWGALLRTKQVRKKQMDAVSEASKILEFMDLTSQKYTPARNLPHGQQRRLEVSIALAVDRHCFFSMNPFRG